MTRVAEFATLRTMKKPSQILALMVLLVGCTFGSQKIDRVVVLKKEHRMILYSGNTVIKSYAVALARGGLRPKEQRGDHRTPEGAYRIDSRRSASAFHRALHVSYPSEADRARARKMGVDPGGDIMIHGIRNGLGWLGSTHRFMDWTDGCIAVTDSEIEEIWGLVGDGTTVEIRP